MCQFGEGWMSNRGRQNVASYLALDLEEDWRQGADWFESCLLDYDVCSNWGNWVAAAGVQQFRVPSEVTYVLDLHQPPSCPTASMVCPTVPTTAGEYRSTGVGMTGGRINAFNITKQVTTPLEQMQHYHGLLAA